MESALHNFWQMARYRIMKFIIFFIYNVHYANSNSIKYKFTCIWSLKYFLFTEKKTLSVIKLKKPFCFHINDEPGPLPTPKPSLWPTFILAFCNWKIINFHRTRENRVSTVINYSVTCKKE